MTHEELQSLLTQAEAEEEQGNYDEAEALSQQILTSLSSLAVVKQAATEYTILQAGATRMLGVVCWRRGVYPQALEHLQAALQSSVQMSDQVGIAKSLGNIGNVHNNLSDYPKALEYFGKALSLDEELGIKGIEARHLGNIGNVHNNLSDNAKALECYVKALGLDEELGNKSGVARHLGNIGNVHKDLSDYPKALEYYSKALSLAEELGNKSGVARHLGNTGNVHYNLSDYPNALEHYGKALSLAEEIGNKSLVADNLCNIGNVHIHLSDYPKALEYFGKALSLDEELGNKAGVARHLGNIGNVHQNLSDNSKALEYYIKALSLDQELGNKSGVARHLSNIGNVHYNLSDYPKALEYFVKALSQAEEIGNKSFVAVNLCNIGNAHNHLSDYPKALEYFGNALSLAEELGYKSLVADILCNIGIMHQELSDYLTSLEYLKRGLSLWEELGGKSEVGEFKSALGALYASDANPNRDESKAEAYLLDSIAVSQELGTKRYVVHKTLADLYEKQKRWEESHYHQGKYFKLKEEVQSEEAQKSAALMEQRRQIAEREKEIAIAKAAADAKHLATEQLLHNVMPQSIANEMLSGKQLIAQKLANVSVMFADIVGFTTLSQSVSAEALVEGLDSVFSAIDTLAEKHGLEKIKTIGDAYMVVCGAPVQREDHAEAMAEFALELAEASKDFSMNTDAKKLQLRIGIHCGEAVAGVIGKKKFAYDLWGDTVNTASRMESHGEAGKIHCSEAFRNVVGKDFQFRERGEMEIRGKGMMRTYFLERA